MTRSVYGGVEVQVFLSDQVAGTICLSFSILMNDKTWSGLCFA